MKNIIGIFLAGGLSVAIYWELSIMPSQLLAVGIIAILGMWLASEIIVWR